MEMNGKNLQVTFFRYFAFTYSSQCNSSNTKTEKSGASPNTEGALTSMFSYLARTEIHQVEPNIEDPEELQHRVLAY